jgi:hypothetical protein
MGIQKSFCQAFVKRALTQLLPAPAFTAQHPLKDHACSQRPRHLRSLFRNEPPVVERSASAYRIAPSHLNFTEPTLLRAAARLAVTSPLAVKPRRRRAWRSRRRNRVRKHSNRVAVFLLLPVASLGILGAAVAIHASLAAAAIHAWRSRGRHRVRQRSSRFVVLFLLAVAFTASTAVAAALPTPPVDSSALPQQYIFLPFLFFSVFSTYFTKIQSGPIAVSDWLSCSRGEPGSHQSAAKSPDSINF